MVRACLYFWLLAAAVPPVVDVESVVRENEDCVVVIVGVREGNDNLVQGSGVCVSAAGHILATAHQVEGVGGLEARFVDGTTVGLRVVESLPELELALLQADGAVPGVARFGDATALRSGSPLVAIAAPQSLDFSTITGIVSSTNRTYMGIPVIQTNLQVDSGASGGPVFDRYGQLVGIIMLNLIDADWISAINPINNAFALLEKHGIYSPVRESAPDGDYELVPAAGVTERELRAVEAYNQGVGAEEVGEKLRAYSLSVALLPGFFEAWFNLAVAQTQAQDFDGAQESYRQALALRGDSLAVYRNLGRLYLRQGDAAAARGAFAEALRLAPGEEQSYNDLGEALRRGGLLGEAVDAFETALSIRPDYASAQYNLAIAHAGSGNRAAAVAAFERYLEVLPDAADGARVRDWVEQLKRDE